MRPQRLSTTRLVKRFTPLASNVIPLPRRGEIASQGDTLGRIGSLEVRLARTPREIRKAQRLRYRVFYEEMSAKPNKMTRATRRDADKFDAICDHLLVIDHEPVSGRFRRKKPQIVGTYRLLRQDVAELNHGFYTTDEYDISGLIEQNPDKTFLELGRSCVLKSYRSKRTVELLWQGIWSYICMHNIDVLFGCASIEGTDPQELAEQLSFIHHSASAPDTWSARAVQSRYVHMNRMPLEAVDQKAVLRQLPPLIKGYMRLGAYVGDGAVIDYQFGTTDVFIVIPISQIDDRYVNYYSGQTRRRAN
ncbi:GNAT family N-acetyltransferase [Coralliovum pocilloporae]|uniref:GNAT family N-acetyltransferase n=1 Tax=Coralliovum pocilloporae TaxID=3066369 RepID=UPI003D9C1F09